MAKKTFTLLDGLQVGDGPVHKEVILRDLRAGDVIEATEDAERAYTADDGRISIAASPTRVGMLILIKRIEKLGDLRMPLTEAEFKKLTLRDMNLINKMADEQEAQTALAARGRGD